MRNVQFERALNAKQKRAWIAIKDVIKNVLGKKRAPPDAMRGFVKAMMDAMKKLRSTITYKMHLLNNHLDDFIQQSSKESDEHGEHIHQLTLPIENRYKGKNRMDSMLAEICWFNQKMMYLAKEDETDNEPDVNDETDQSESDDSDENPDESVVQNDSDDSEEELFLAVDPNQSDESDEGGESDDDSDDEPTPKRPRPGPSTSKDAMEIS